MDLANEDPIRLTGGRTVHCSVVAHWNYAAEFLDGGFQEPHLCAIVAAHLNYKNRTHPRGSVICSRPLKYPCCRRIPRNPTSDRVCLRFLEIRQGRGPDYRGL